MKKFIITTIFTLMLFCTAHGNTIINVPIDSRPISDEYLENLAKIGGDSYISVDKKNMDFFSAYEPDNHLGKSSEVRKELRNIVSQNNSDKVTVIINTSTYITNGLVGSRCAVNYSDYKTALEELESLMTTYSAPKYYVNMSMPRALPETRFNKIWPDNKKIKGIAWYYINSNPNDANKDKYSAYIDVTPEQALMEYGYVANKVTELGSASKLTQWEKGFYNDFTVRYANKDPYKKYVEDYRSTYVNCADIFAQLIKFKKAGLLDEIVVSNDDLQLPDSIAAFNANGADWVQKSEGSPVKYSYARTYSEIMPTSIHRTISDNYSYEEKTKATLGRSDFVNIINGTDEVPQLIYARDYSKRKKTSAKFNIYSNKLSENVGKQDVKRSGAVTNAAVFFVSGSTATYTAKPVDMYLYNYESEGNKEAVYNLIRKSLSKGNNTAFVELFGTGSISNGNYMFDLLLKSNMLHQLCAYSAWNTNGNAIGLGIAQSQVFAIANEKNGNQKSAAKAQTELLLQHLIEDGVYTSHVKRDLSNIGYRPTDTERTQSDMLFERLETSKITDALKGKTITFGGQKFEISKIDINKTSFPWGRIFDMYIESTVSLKNVK